MKNDQSPNSTVVFGDQEYPYTRRWFDRLLLPIDGYLAFDTETDVVDLKTHVPRLAMASASAGDKDNSLIHPDDIGKFILAHRGLHFVCHNAAFDFWVIEHHLRIRGEEKSRQAWWDVACRNHLHDSMLLDMLTRLAQDDSFPDPRDLAQVAKIYTGMVISKDDPYRMRYGEIIGRDWCEVEPRFFEYGIKDAIVTRLTYLAIRKQAIALAEEFRCRTGGDILPAARQKFGLLTEAVQVKKAIALTQLSRNGMTVDLSRVRRTESELREELIRSARAAQSICPVYRVDATGTFITSGKTDAPAFQDEVLRDHLATIKERIEKETDALLRIPMTSKGISRSVKVWSDFAHMDPFLLNWIRAQELAKLLQFFTMFEDHVDLGELAKVLLIRPEDLACALNIGANGADPALNIRGLRKIVKARHRILRQLGLDPERVLAAVRSLTEVARQSHCVVHPSYTPMVRTGRTSCSKPNVQQIPKDSAFRQSFVASDGHFLLAVDYSFIELCTFAATALHRYGRSDMADVIKAGVDPHAHTAAMMLGVTPAEFLSWKDNETVAEARTVDGKEIIVRFKDKFDKARSQAKPINFGVPGGLGVASLVAYAHSTYKVDFTFEEAKKRRELITKQIYKELDHYLAEDGVLIVARNLRAPIWEVRNELGDIHISSVRKILTGNPMRTDGKPYQPTFISRTWASLIGLNRNPELKEELEKRTPSESLAARVCHAGVATLSGRIRGRVRYSQARNTPFQGLAADGAALALFELIKEGFRVIGFIHDEILIELPDEGGYVSEGTVRHVEKVMCQQMKEVLVGDIPVGCEAALSQRWNKKAKLISQDGKVIPWEPLAPKAVPAEADACHTSASRTVDPASMPGSSGHVQATRDLAVSVSRAVASRQG